MSRLGPIEPNPKTRDTRATRRADALEWWRAFFALDAGELWEELAEDETRTDDTTRIAEALQRAGEWQTCAVGTVATSAECAALTRAGEALGAVYQAESRRCEGLALDWGERLGRANAAHRAALEEHHAPRSMMRAGVDFLECFERATDAPSVRALAKELDAARAILDTVRARWANGLREVDARGQSHTTELGESNGLGRSE